MSKGGRPRAIQGESEEVLREIVDAAPEAPISEIRRELMRRAEVRVSRVTVQKALRRLGYEWRRRPSAGRASAAGGAKPQRYGYRERHRTQGPEQSYPSSLTDAEWALVADLFEGARSRGGAPRRHATRRVLDACLYVLRTGCSWRQLPNDFPAWQGVYKHFRQWGEQGLFEQMHDRLREFWRLRCERAGAPSAAVIDAQSTRASPQGGSTGFDGGKKVKGRKRHLLVDTLGLVLAVSVTAASVQDRDGAHPLMREAMAKYPSVQRIYADGGYAGRCAQTISQQQGVEVEVVPRPHSGRWCQRDDDEFHADLFAGTEPAGGFEPLPKRWVVERTHAWNERARRLIMHHDRRTDIAEQWVWLAEARILLNRVSHSV